MTSSWPIIGSKPGSKPPTPLLDDPPRDAAAIVELQNLCADFNRVNGILTTMCYVAQAARIFYNWIADLADALVIELGAALQIGNIKNKEAQMAPDIARPDDKNHNGSSHHLENALAEAARLNG